MCFPHIFEQIHEVHIRFLFFFFGLLQTKILQMVVWLNEQLVKALGSETVHRKGSNRWMDNWREYCLVHNVGASKIKNTPNSVLK